MNEAWYLRISIQLANPDFEGADERHLLEEGNEVRGM